MDDHLNDPPTDPNEAVCIAFARRHWASIRKTIPDAQLITSYFAADLIRAGRVTMHAIDKELAAAGPAGVVVWSELHTGLVTVFVHGKGSSAPRPKRR